MKIIFLGTPEFGLTVLKSLVNSKHEVVAVVCQPDKPVGRKQILTPPPTKVFALENNIPVYQFNSIRKEGLTPLKALNADVMVTAAFGQILSEEILNITPNGTINVHGSLLPKYRGAAPVQMCLVNAEEETGVTIMKTDVGVDTGDMILSEKVKIENHDTVESILEKLAVIGSKLLLEVLDQIENKTVKFIKQNESEATYFPMIKKEDALLDFDMETKFVLGKIRGYKTWPTAYFFVGDKKIKVYEAEIFENLTPEEQQIPAGEFIRATSKTGLIVKTQNGAVRLKTLQIEGGKPMDDKSFLNGNANLFNS